jgi:6-phosphofructokinase 1
MVIEVMGRDAGWIALKAGAAGGGDVILIPEIPFDLEKVCRKVAEREARGARFSIVVVAEGARSIDGGKALLESAEDAASGFERLGGMGERVAAAVHERLGVECRVTVLGHVQRGGSPSARDRVLGTRFGVGAVELVERKEFGRMVAIRGNQITSVALSEVGGRTRPVPVDGDEIRAIEAVGVSFGR